MRLGDQTWLWTIGFYRPDRADRGLRLMLLWQWLPEPAGGVWPRPRRRAERATAPLTHLARRACWVALAAVPSGLLVAVTAHISTDVAAVPLLWVIPLALYLLTFVIVFARRPIIPHWLVVAVQPVFIIALVGRRWSSIRSRPSLG